MGLGGELAAGQGGAAQARARVVGAAQRDQRAGERELVAGRDALGETQAAQPLVERGGDRVVVALGGGAGQPDQRVDLQRIELERAAPRILGGGRARGGVAPARRGVEIAEPRPRARAGPVIAAQLGEPSDLAPRGERRRRITGGEQLRRHLVDRRVVGGQRAGSRQLVTRPGGIAELVHEHVGEPQVELHGARGVAGDAGARPHQPHQLGPALLVGEPVGQRVGRLGRRRIVLDRELVEHGRGPGVEHAEQARRGQRGERGLIVVGLGAGQPGDLLEVLGGLPGVALGERDRGQRRVRRGERGPPAERLARQLEPVEEPRRARGGEHEDPLEQQRLVGAARGEQRAVAAHRVLEVTAVELLVDRVHQIVRRGELMGPLADAELADPGAGRSIGDLDRAARHADVGQLDLGDRGQPPAAGRQHLPQQRADEIDLDIAQTPRDRALAGGGGVAGAEQRDQHAIGDHRPGRRQVAVDPDRARHRAELGPGVDQLDVEREVGRGETIGGPGADRDVAIVEPGGELGQPRPRQLPGDLDDPRIERGLRDPHGQAAQPRPPALEPLRRGGAGIGAELGDLELELVDPDRSDRQIGEREAADTSVGVEVEGQPARRGESSVGHYPEVTPICARRLRLEGCISTPSRQVKRCRTKGSGLGSGAPPG